MRIVLINSASVQFAKLPFGVRSEVEGQSDRAPVRYAPNAAVPPRHLGEIHNAQSVQRVAAEIVQPKTKHVRQHQGLIQSTSTTTALCSVNDLINIIAFHRCCSTNKIKIISFIIIGRANDHIGRITYIHYLGGY